MTDDNDLSSLLSENAGTGETDTIQATETGAVSQVQSETAFKMDNWARRRAEQVNEEWEEQGLDAIDDVNTVADCHEALFNPSPVQAENCADKRRADWFQQLIETPDFQALHNQTMLDADMSAIASREICNNYVEYASQAPPDNPGGTPGGDGAEQEESIGETVARIRSTGKAIAQAKDDMQSAKDTASGLGAGAGTGGKLDRSTLAKLSALSGILHS